MTVDPARGNRSLLNDTRERRLTRGRMDVGRKADDGSSSGFLFSSTVGVATRQVVLCLNWCASPGKPESTTSNARTKPVTSSTGKRSAVKVACCVWAGGKSASSYLSVPPTGIFPSARTCGTSRVEAPLAPSMRGLPSWELAGLAHLPYQDGPIRASRGDGRAVRRLGHHTDRGSVTAIGSSSFIGVWIPDLNRAIPSARQATSHRATTRRRSRDHCAPGK